ncbi:MAG: peptide deformylase [Thermoanaerobaculia bacterium]
MIRDVLLYPDPMLRLPGRPVPAEELASPECQNLIVDLIETMYAQKGAVGLAAPQVGESLRIFVMDSAANAARDRLRVLVNPVITQQSQWKFAREGCLSFPDILVTVKRARRATAGWCGADGTPASEELNDFEAVILQHEVDHLHGILFLDRARNLQTDLIRRTGG